MHSGKDGVVNISVHNEPCLLPLSFRGRQLQLERLCYLCACYRLFFLFFLSNTLGVFEELQVFHVDSHLDRAHSDVYRAVFVGIVEKYSLCAEVAVNDGVAFLSALGRTYSSSST